MGNGEIQFVRIPMILDVDVADTVLQVGVNGLFPPLTLDLLSSQIVPISGGSGRSKSVLVVAGRRITA